MKFDVDTKEFFIFQVYVIDVSQAVEPNHPHALEFLLRDCRNISKFFNNSGVEDVLEPMQLFNDVSGYVVLGCLIRLIGIQNFYIIFKTRYFNGNKVHVPF